VEKDSIRPDVSTAQVTFGFKNKEDFKLEEIREAIAKKTSFQVGKVIKEP
jgi:hypothetical protein